MLRPERRGVTLIEMLVALTVAGIVLASASRTLVSVDAATRATYVEARRADKVANGPRALRELVSQIEPSSDSMRQFRGNEAGAAFQSWCRAPGGWSERCSVALTVRASEGQVALIGTLFSRDTLSLLTGARTLELRYFDAGGTEGGRWLRAWGAGILAPYALGVLVDGDTVVVRIGDRG